MPISRRRFIAAGGAALAATTAAPGLAGLTGRPRPNVAWAAGCRRSMTEPLAELHLLNRATFGPSRYDLARLRSLGMDRWIEEQLAPERIDDSAVDTALAPLETIGWSSGQLKTAGNRPVSNELVAATIYRAVASRRQLLEVMVDLWSNHFNVYHPEELIARTKTVDDREIFRKHALGSFRDLVHGSSASASMMRYLNTVRNTKAGPNENFARELMELHVLGVDGGYSEADVKQVARCFTGWNIANADWSHEFRAGDHVDGDKWVLGTRIPAGGADEGRRVIDLLVDQPAAAMHVAGKLCQRFVSDAPPAGLVARVAAAFGRDGDIKAMLRAIFASAEFYEGWQAPPSQGSALPGPGKIRRPIEYWAGVMRALEVDASPILREIPLDHYDDNRVVYEGRAESYLQQMDQLPFRWHAPDGYPERGPWWSGMHVMLGRWNYALDLAEGNLYGIKPDLLGQMRADGVPTTPAEIVDYWIDRTVRRPLDIVDRQKLILFISRGDAGPLPDDLVRARLPMLVALLFDSPYFQWR